MQMPGRTLTAANYRYGFNGKENDNEVKDEGNQQDYGMRIYDPRVGRFLSVDPLSSKYAMLTPYQYASNTPIQAIDIDGLEAAVTTFFYNTRKDAKVEMTNATLVVDNTKRRSESFMINLNSESYKANSYTTLQGRDDRNNFNGDFSNIRKLSTNDIAGILGYSDFVFNVANQGKTKEQTVLHESGAGPLQTSRALLDFKNRLYEIFDFKQDELIAIDGVAYNANEAGNYLWGMALEEAGIMMDAKKIAELGTRGRHDEPHEQKAIQAGINKANSFLKTGMPNDVREKAFNYYTEDYYEFLKEGGDKSKFTPSDNLGVFKQYSEQNEEPKK